VSPAVRGLLVALLTWAVASATAQAAVLEYLYVEPNVGGSMGGHVGLRIGDDVYHYQNAELGLLRIRRTPYEHFRYVYSVRDNRSIQIARIAVSEQTFGELRGRFNRRYLVQNKHFDVLESLSADRDLVRRVALHRGEAVDAMRVDPPPLRLRGAGFFREDAAGSHAMRSLRERIDAEYGEAFLSDRIEDVEARMRGVAPVTGSDRPPPPRVSADLRPAAGYTFSEHYADLGERLLSLRALADGSALRPEARLTVDDAVLELSDGEQDALRAFAARLEDRLVSLPSSKRPDWGFALLVGMARLDAVHEGLRIGRLALLDAFPEDPVTLDRAEIRRRRPYLEELGTAEREVCLAARERFFQSESPGELEFAQLEEACNRAVEIARGLQGDHPIRLESAPLVPSRRATVHSLPPPALRGLDLPVEIRLARRRAREYEDRMREHFGYDLLRHNCVTELFATIAREYDDDEARRRLGGSVRTDESLHYIPAVSYGAVLDAFDGAERAEIPSYRRTRLETMYAEENDVAVYLRESNTLTSSVYRRSSRDSFFLFFTDDRVATRPLFGVFNVVAGLGETTLGLLRSPFDGGRTLVSGLKGVAFSLPELAFMSFRKGTLEVGPSTPPRTSARTLSP